MNFSGANSLAMFAVYITLESYSVEAIKYSFVMKKK